MAKLLSATTLALLMTTSAMALECPIPVAVNDAASAAAVRQVLPAGVDLDAPQALQSSVFELRQAGVGDDAIVDNLISAYCTSVNAQPGLSDDDKTQKINTFSDEVDKAMFGAAAR